MLIVNEPNVPANSVPRPEVSDDGPGATEGDVSRVYDVLGVQLGADGAEASEDTTVDTAGADVVLSATPIKGCRCCSLVIRGAEGALGPPTPAVCWMEDKRLPSIWTGDVTCGPP